MLPRKSVFISHSQNDVTILNAVTSAIARTNVRQFCMEYENYDKRHKPPYNKIYEEMFVSSSLFLLMGKNLLKNSFTQNWVSYEVGLAHGMKKPIWVFEDFKEQVLFPVPYLDHYMVFNPSDKSHIDSITAIVREIEKGLIVKLIDFFFETVLTSLRITCQQCGVSYNLHSNVDELNCPSCRERVILQKIL